MSDNELAVNLPPRRKMKIEKENSSQLEPQVVQKITEVIEKIKAKSYLANDVWDSTNGYRRYQDFNVPVVELRIVIKLLNKLLESNSR